MPPDRLTTPRPRRQLFLRRRSKGKDSTTQPIRISSSPEPELISRNRGRAGSVISVASDSSSDSSVMEIDNPEPAPIRAWNLDSLLSSSISRSQPRVEVPPASQSSTLPPSSQRTSTTLTAEEGIRVDVPRSSVQLHPFPSDTHPTSSQQTTTTTIPCITVTPPSTSVVNSTSSTRAHATPPESSDSLRSRVQDKINEIYILRRRCDNLTAHIERLEEELRVLLLKLNDAENIPLVHATEDVAQVRPASENDAVVKNYEDTNVWPWKDALKKHLKEVFNLNEFRTCQEAVCNANLDGRDIICVMPTGGGKSLTYQLPALLGNGCTIVISPLVALMLDQVAALRELNINAVMLWRDAPAATREAIFEGLRTLGDEGNNKKINLCYVTPERVAQNDRFKRIMQEMVEAGTLDRVVIDEAHCISHHLDDYEPFREDYTRLGIIREQFPTIPIMALSATCSPKVCDDILQSLHLASLTQAKAAKSGLTVYFTAPLYRPNLHYKVIPKHPGTKTVLQSISKYICTEHLGQSGIIYCFTRDDATKTAVALSELSGGNIITAAFHSTLCTVEKENIHAKWKNNEIHVVCATNAFGLGVNKADVRFVIHLTIPKRLDSLFQESGRAGRDGKPADCLIYYRPHDSLKVFGLITTGRDNLSSPQQREKLEGFNNMVKFVHNTTDCRKDIFGKYLQQESVTGTGPDSVPLWANHKAACGHCDNCQMWGLSEALRDCTLEAWIIVKIVARASKSGHLAGIRALISHLRGKEAVRNFDHQITWSEEEIMFLVVHLVLEGYLTLKSVKVGIFAPMIYLLPDFKATSLLRFSKEDICCGLGPQISCSFLSMPQMKPSLSLWDASKIQTIISTKKEAPLYVKAEEEIVDDVESHYSWPASPSGDTDGESECVDVAYSDIEEDWENREYEENSEEELGEDTFIDIEN